MFGERKERKRKAGVLGRHALPRPPCIAVVWLSPTADTLRSLGALCEQSRETRRLANLCYAPGNALGNSSLPLSAATALALPQTLRDGVLSAVARIKTAQLPASRQGRLLLTFPKNAANPPLTACPPVRLCLTFVKEKRFWKVARLFQRLVEVRPEQILPPPSP